MGSYSLTNFGSSVDTTLSTLLPTFWVDNSSSYELDSHLNSGPRDPTQLGPISQQPLTNGGDVAEDIGIRLVHALLMCAEAIQCGNLQLASSLVVEMTNELLTRVNTSSGIGKVAGYFIEGLSRRLCQPGQFGFESLCYEVLYHSFYEASPYLKFAHFTANQSILEAFKGHDYVHVIDFDLINGLQWPAFIQALALRPGGPPSLRLTAISSPQCKDQLEFVGLKLAEVAKSINVKFTFGVVTISRLQDLKPCMFQTNQSEALAVNYIFQLHQLLASGIEPVLECIRCLNPNIITIIEQEANLNQPDDQFLLRFTEALHYYSTMFDSLEACPIERAKPLAELYLQKEICNILCCEGEARVERLEPLAKWQLRLSQAGFKTVNMGHIALKQARMLLTMFACQGFNVDEIEGCLMLGWHDRPLIAASAWVAKPEPECYGVCRAESSCLSSLS